jgi:hypothetical protein
VQSKGFEQGHLDKVGGERARLTDKHPHIPSDQVSFVIQTVCAQFRQSPIRDFVPLLVERRAGAELAKLKEAVPAPL